MMRAGSPVRRRFLTIGTVGLILAALGGPGRKTGGGRAGDYWVQRRRIRPGRHRVRPRAGGARRLIECNRFALFLAAVVPFAAEPPAVDFTTDIRQVTSGPKHHFFGYIGHVQTIPWNKSGRFIVALQTGFQDRMPEPAETADIVLLDTRDGYAVRVVDRTRAWNFQQGTMLYWNPDAPETQFFFNDRDPETNAVFCVLFDIAKGRNGGRIAEYRFDDTPVGNGGTMQRGGWFAGINYGRLARLRPVTGYPGAADWTAGTRRHPENDGIFKVHVKTKEKRLLVSFKRLADALRGQHPDIDEKEIFVNHTLWNRDDSRLFFFVRGDFDRPDRRLDVPFTIKADGSDLRPLALHIGGHPEWESGHVMIGRRGRDQILFDMIKQEFTGILGTPEIFPNPGGDVALSPDGRWFVNGHADGGKNYYTVLRRADGAWVRTAGLDQNGYTAGNLRIDPSPCWNRNSTQILAAAADREKTRQMFLITMIMKSKP